MSLERQLNATLESLLSSLSPVSSPRRRGSISNMQLIQCMDLTLLEDNPSLQDLDWVLTQSKTKNLAALCVYVKDLPYFQSATISKATVVNFPNGNESIESCFTTIKKACKLQVAEIDYVFPYALYLENQKQRALDHCKEIAQECKRKKLTLKIILETCAYPDMQSIYQLSQELIALEPDFLKTSTGKGIEGATLSAVFAMLCAIKESQAGCGIKVSGGVKTLDKALIFANLSELLLNKSIDKSWFRIGASSLLKEFL